MPKQKLYSGKCIYLDKDPFKLVYNSEPFLYNKIHDYIIEQQLNGEYNYIVSYIRDFTSHLHAIEAEISEKDFNKLFIDLAVFRENRINKILE